MLARFSRFALKGGLRTPRVNVDFVALFAKVPKAGAPENRAQTLAPQLSDLSE